MKQGWKTKKLFEVCDIVGGSTPKTNEPSYWNGEYYWVTPAELNNEKYISFTQRTITNIGVKSAHLQLLPTGTVLLSSRAPIGKLAITTVPMYCNQGFKNLVCGKEIYNEYAYYFLLKNKDYLNSLGTGATFKEISKRVVEQILIPFPSIEEQQRIVDILDKEFEKIDTLKANAEKGLQYAKDLFWKILQKNFNGENCTLGDVLNLRRGHDLTHGEMLGGSIPVAGSGGIIGYHNVASFIEPCITVGRSGSVGKVYVYDKCWAHNTVLYVDDFKGNNPYYLTYLLISLDLAKEKSGCGVPTLNRNYLHPIKIGFNFKQQEQENIVSNLDKLNEQCKVLQANYEKTIALCDDMKQTLLRKAFNGEL